MHLSSLRGCLLHVQLPKAVGFPPPVAHSNSCCSILIRSPRPAGVGRLWQQGQLEKPSEPLEGSQTPRVLIVFAGDAPPPASSLLSIARDRCQRCSPIRSSKSSTLAGIDSHASQSLKSVLSAQHRHDQNRPEGRMLGQTSISQSSTVWVGAAASCPAATLKASKYCELLVAALPPLLSGLRILLMYE